MCCSYNSLVRDPNFSNVLVNAIAVMLIYSGHFGSCAIAVSKTQRDILGGYHKSFIPNIPNNWILFVLNSVLD